MLFTNLSNNKCSRESELIKYLKNLARENPEEGYVFRCEQRTDTQMLCNKDSKGKIRSLCSVKIKHCIPTTGIAVLVFGNDNDVNEAVMCSIENKQPSYIGRLYKKDMEGEVLRQFDIATVHNALRLPDDMVPAEYAKHFKDFIHSLTVDDLKTLTSFTIRPTFEDAVQNEDGTLSVCQVMHFHSAERGFQKPIGSFLEDCRRNLHWVARQEAAQELMRELGKVSGTRVVKNLRVSLRDSECDEAWAKGALDACAFGVSAAASPKKDSGPISGGVSGLSNRDWLNTRSPGRVLKWDEEKSGDWSGGKFPGKGAEQPEHGAKGSPASPSLFVKLSPPSTQMTLKIPAPRGPCAKYVNVQRPVLTSVFMFTTAYFPTAYLSKDHNKPSKDFAKEARKRRDESITKYEHHSGIKEKKATRTTTFIFLEVEPGCKITMAEFSALHDKLCIPNVDVLNSEYIFACLSAKMLLPYGPYLIYSLTHLQNMRKHEQATGQKAVLPGSGAPSAPMAPRKSESRFAAVPEAGKGAPDIVPAAAGAAEIVEEPADEEATEIVEEPADEKAEDKAEEVTEEVTEVKPDGAHAQDAEESFECEEGSVAHLMEAIYLHSFVLAHHMDCLYRHFTPEPDVVSDGILQSTIEFADSFAWHINLFYKWYGKDGLSLLRMFVNFSVILKLDDDGMFSSRFLRLSSKQLPDKIREFMQSSYEHIEFKLLDDPDSIVHQARETYRRIYPTNNRLMHRLCLYIQAFDKVKSQHQRILLETCFSEWNEGMCPEAGADAGTDAGADAGANAEADAEAYAGPYA